MRCVQCPVSLPREVLQWVQNLQLTRAPSNVRRDFSNGFLVANIFSCFYPKVFLLYSYQNGSSLSIKLDNWRRIEKSLQKLDVHLSKDLINETIHLEMGAAERLLVEIYCILTKQKITVSRSEPDIDKNSLHRDQQRETESTHTDVCSSSLSQSSVNFKEIRVNQPIRRFIQQ